MIVIDGVGYYSMVIIFMMLVDLMNFGGGNGNIGGNNGNIGGNIGNNGVIGGNNGNGLNIGLNLNGGFGLGIIGFGLGLLGNGFGINGSGYYFKLSIISYGIGNYGKIGYLFSIGEKEFLVVIISLFGVFVVFFVSMGIIKCKCKN